MTLILDTKRDNVFQQAIRARRSAELQYEEASARLKDLTTINVNISNAKAKLEQELCVIAGDYDEVSKELRVSRPWD